MEDGRVKILVSYLLLVYVVIMFCLDGGIIILYEVLRIYLFLSSSTPPKAYSHMGCMYYMSVISSCTPTRSSTYSSRSSDDCAVQYVPYRRTCSDLCWCGGWAIVF